MAQVANRYPDIFGYILSEEEAFRTKQIPLANNYEWNMYDHIDRSYTLKNSHFTKGNNDFKRPFNNIILPIANVNYRTEGFNVKDVEIYVNNSENYHKSLLARKFHAKWAKKYSIDTAIDESVESYFDYGLALVKNVNDKRPEVVQLQQIAFADQTDILSGPICLKHQFSISQLEEMRGKWDDEAIDRAISNSRFSQQRTEERETQTPGKYVEIYELHGTFPNEWLEDDQITTDGGKYSKQIHIVTYYVDTETKQKNGIHLFKGKETEDIFKALKRDDIYGRACGRGGIEELFHPQVWTNYSEIHIQQMLEAVSKVIIKTNDPNFSKNNDTKNIKHNQVFQVEEGKDASQFVIQAPNKTAFDNFVNKWEQTARTIGSASDPQLGLNPVSGTPLGTTEIVTSQGQGIHEYRRGKISVFWHEIYTDWVLDYLEEDMLKGDQWVDELTVDELAEISEIAATKELNKKIKQAMINGEVMTLEEQQQFKQLFKEGFTKQSRRRFLEIMKDEFKNLALDVEFNIAGKQAYQAEMVNKLNSVFRAVFANPQILQNDAMGELFNNILESAGLSPINFAKFTMQQSQQTPQQPAQTPQGVVEQPVAQPTA